MKKLYRTVAFVTILSCAERFIGFIYRIFLSRYVGAEGLGLYQIALSVAGVVVTLTASGIPVTVSRLMIKEKSLKGGKAGADVVTAGIIAALAISIPVCMFLYFAKPLLSGFFADERCYDVLVVMLPGIVLTSVYAVIRGFFWGNRYYGAYSIIELIEELSMFIAGVIIITKTRDAFSSAIGAGQAVLISYVVSFIISTVTFVVKSGRVANPVKQFRPLICSASPITLTKTLTSLTGFLVALVIPARLAASGVSGAEATKSFGELTGMALPLLFIPSTIIGSIALVSLPEISESYYSGNPERLVSGVKTAFSFSVFVSALIIPIFISCGEEIGKFVYDNAQAGRYLSVSAIIMLPMSASLICCSVLNSLGKEKLTLLNFLAGAVCMFAAIWFLTAKIGIYSLIVGYGISYVVTALLDFFLTVKSLENKGGLKKSFLLTFVYVIPATAFACFLNGLLSNFLSGFLLILFVGIISAAFSFALLSVGGAININELFPFLKNLKTKRKRNSYLLDKTA